MLRVLIIVLTGTLLLLQSTPQGQRGGDWLVDLGDESATAASSWYELETDPNELWERALEAKGGRTRLHGVRNMVIESSSSYTTHLGRGNSLYREHLLVFPSKYWEWEDMRPDVFGLRITMKNYETKMAYVITRDARPEDYWRPLSDGISPEEALLAVQLKFFMETQWVRPKPNAAWRTEVNGKAAYVLETSVMGERFDFVLDAQTYLPMQLVSYFDTSNRGAAKPVGVIELSDYATVNGLKVPLRSKPQGGVEAVSKVQINVEYDSEIFSKPTSIKAGSNAWKK